MSDFHSEAVKGPHKVLELGDLELELGGVLTRARLAYKTHGTPNGARDNASLNPHMYAATPSSLEPTIAPGRTLDPERWFVICPAMLGGGFSSSPSNTDGEFPELTIGDDVRAQALLLEHLGVDRLALGFSMGAQQAYEWAVRFPDRSPDWRRSQARRARPRRIPCRSLSRRRRSQPGAPCRPRQAPGDASRRVAPPDAARVPPAVALRARGRGRNSGRR